MLDRRLQGDGFHGALSRFGQASSSSFLVLSWEAERAGKRGPATSSIARVNSVSTSNSLQQKTTHMVVAEGKLVDINLEAVKKYLAKGLCFHVLLRLKDDVALIQQMNKGSSSSIQRKRALAAGQSLTALIPSVTVSITVSEPEELTEELLRSKLGNAFAPADSSQERVRSISSSSDASIKTITEVPLADVPRSVTDSPPPQWSPDQGSAWTATSDPFQPVQVQQESLPILLDSRSTDAQWNRHQSMMSVYQTSDTSFHDCEESFVMSCDVGQGWKNAALLSSDVKPSRAEPENDSVEKKLPLLPKLEPAPNMRYSAFQSSERDLWVLDKELSYIPDSEESYESAVSKRKGFRDLRLDQDKENVILTRKGKLPLSPVERERLRRQADEAKRERVMKRLEEEQNSWEDDGIPSYYNTESTDTLTRRGPSVPVVQEKASKKALLRAPPLSPPPHEPLPLSPSPSTPTRFHRNRPAYQSKGTPTPLIFDAPKSALFHELRKEEEEEVERDDLISPIITLGGHAKSRIRSQSVTSKTCSQRWQAEEDLLRLHAMQPLMASIELARRKEKDMKQKGLQGESWITMRQRERSRSDATGMGVPGWALEEDDEMKEGKIEFLQSRHRELCNTLSDIQSGQRELEEAERLHSIKWAGEELFRQSLDAFERSKREATERKRKMEVERIRQGEKLKSEAIQKQQREIKTAMEESLTCRDKVEQIGRVRQARKIAEEREEEEKQQRALFRKQLSAERRATLRVELQTTGGSTMAKGLFTVQKEDGLRKRRRYELHRDCLLVFSETGSSRVRSIGGTREAPLTKVFVGTGCIISIRDALEDTQASHSFHIRYNNNNLENREEQLLAYTDTEEEKERLLIALSLLSCYTIIDGVFDS